MMMKLILQSFVCFSALWSFAHGEDFKPRSSDVGKTKLRVATAKIVLVGNEEPWLEILVPQVESKHNEPSSLSVETKLVRLPVHRAVAWNANGDRLRDELITNAFQVPISVIVNDQPVHRFQLTSKSVYVNENMQFDRFDEYRKFQRDGVRNRRADMKTPPDGSFDTGDYFVRFSSPYSPTEAAKRLDILYLFLPPEFLDKSH